MNSLFVIGVSIGLISTLICLAYLKQLNKRDDVDLTKPNIKLTRKSIDELLLRCPCCGYKTLERRAFFEICEVCFWEDDGQDDEDADEVLGGPNGQISLSQGRVNFKKFGASQIKDLPYVRPPRSNEL